MVRAALSVLTCLALLLPRPSEACGNDGYAESYPKLKALHVAEAAKLLKSKKAVVVDVNQQSFRERHGTLPGAIVLSSYDQYEVAELPPKKRAKQLIFYCVNMRCEAAWMAAERARAAGYKNVGVLISGLLGWKHEGEKVEPHAPRS